MVAGHGGDIAAITPALVDPDPHVRAAALGALDRNNALDTSALVEAIRDPSPEVRRRVCRLAAHHHSVAILPLLDDEDASVVEVACWSAGERPADSGVVERLSSIAIDHDDPLCRESAAAALGAIGDAAGLAAVLAACTDRPTVRRRAVLALAAFEGDQVDAALTRALDDRDWQVRQAAEDLLEVDRVLSGEVDPDGWAD